MMPLHPAPCPQALTGRLRAALAFLLQADDLAGQRRRDAWQYAVEIATLRGAGLNLTEVRWFVDSGYLLHAVETTIPQDAARSFVVAHNLGFAERTCFVLTPEGAALARTLSTRGAGDDGGAAGGRPRWIVRRRELHCGVLLVKRFVAPAPNQELVLSAFEEEGWPGRLDDPLPGESGLDGPERLRE